VVLLDLAAWTLYDPPLWAPVAGFGLALVAWFGWRFAVPILLVGGLVTFARAAFDLAEEPSLALPLLGCILGSLVLDVLEPIFAWWLYHHQGHGSRRLADPRSATQFVFLVPGVAAALSAFARSALLWLLGGAVLAAESSFPDLTVRFWLGRALGMLIVAPPLLVIATPWLIRRGSVAPEPPGARPAEWERSDPFLQGGSSLSQVLLGGRATVGDWVEVAGLAAGASILCLLLGDLHGRGDLLGWQLWGAQMLMLVWASVRQGLRGGTLVAATAGAVPLLVRTVWSRDETDSMQTMLLQGHLLAQCSAAVLVAAAASWVRMHENGYRQIVAHIPVVIYSARLLRPAQGLGSISAMQGQPHVNVAEVTLVSAASDPLLGCPAEHLLGDYSLWLAFVHPDDREVVLAAIEQLARQAQPVTCEYRLAGQIDPGSARKGPGAPPFDPATSKRVRWLRDTLAPQRDADGRLLGWDGVVTDITEQRALADDLRRTTTMFHALVTNLPTGVFFIQGPHGQPILVNARARQLLGQREDSAAGLEYLPKVYRLFRPDGTLYPATELPVYLALREGRTTMRDDIVVHRPDGRRVPLVTWAAPVQLGSRSGPDAAVWVMEDLTALHQAEAARKSTQARLRAVIETMAEGLLVHDSTGRIVTGNPAACAFFGLPAEQLHNRVLAELEWKFLREDGTPLPDQDHPCEVALRTGRPVRNLVLGVVKKDRETGKEPSSASLSPPAPPLRGSLSFEVRWLLVNAMPLSQGAIAPDPSEPRGTAPGLVTTFSDISAYVHAREAIRVSEERYRGLIESLPLMLIQSDRNMRVTYINPATQAISGYSLEEIAEPAAWSSTIHPEDLPRIFEMSRSALAGQGERGEFRFRAKDGSEKVAFVITQPRYQEAPGRGAARSPGPLGANGEREVVGATTLLVDVTRERSLERELQRAQRLELIGRLSSGVAHDFNNLLGVVLNLTDLARGHLPGDHPVHADLRRIAEAGEQAAALAGQLLAFSKQRPAPARRVEVNSVARRTLELLQATLPASIHLVADLSGIDVSIQGDETQVQQVLMNLCLNARDAMPQGGTLSVSTCVEAPASSELPLADRRLQNEEGDGPRPSSSAKVQSAIANLPADRCVRLSVEDSGKGISDEVRERIFEPFFSTREGGTGLGLAVVQQIVESYGGSIEVHSRPGEGSRFDIRWPLAR
jgi:PAS domain S-box-containing protein